MNRPEHILRTLDARLSHPVRLILYGRAALCLGFPNSPAIFATTMDVDAILPEVELSRIEADDNFWNALELTNRDLESEGLYLTHLFLDSQVILTAGWIDRIVAIPLKGMNQLSLYRPATSDLLLTKMMRVDPQDRAQAFEANAEWLLADPD